MNKNFVKSALLFIAGVVIALTLAKIFSRDENNVPNVLETRSQ